MPYKDPEKRRAYHRRYSRGYMQAWRESNREEDSRRSRDYYNRNTEKCRATKRDYYVENRDQIKDKVIRYQQNNREKIRAGQRLRMKDPHRRIRQTLNVRIWRAINKRKFGIRTMEMLGCSMNDFILYIESKFQVGMTWENYGSAWHVDHIMPCAIFDLTKPEHQRRCFHFSNLQPLFAVDNIRKSDTITTNQFNLL